MKSLLEIQEANRKERLENTQSAVNEAVSLARRIGPAAAARQLSVSVNSIWNWIHQQNVALGKIRPRRQVWPLEFREHAVNLMQQMAVPEVSKRLGVSVVTLYKWRTKSAQGWPAGLRDVRGYPRAFKEFAMLLVEEIGIRETAKILDFPYGTLASWGHLSNIERGALRTVARYSKEDKARALQMLASGIPLARVALTEGIKEGTLRHWELKTRENRRSIASARKFPREIVEKILDQAIAEGVEVASVKNDVSTKMIRAWARQRGIVFAREKGLQVSADKELRWLAKVPEMNSWRQLGIAWIATQEQGISLKLQCLRVLFHRFIIAMRLPMDPERFFSKANRIPSFLGNAIPDTRHGRVINNYACDFLKNVLYINFSNEDAYGMAVIRPDLHNPLVKAGFSDRPSHSQSIQPTLPYGLLEEMSKILVAGPNFCDWKWAQSALGVSEGQPGTIARDWFPVKREQIDINDPDCVWRERLRGYGSGGVVLEMWSPVRWVALLIRYILPWRNFQVRVLDSGEADTYIFEGNGFGKGAWTKNASPLAMGTELKPRAQGVFRRPPLSGPFQDDCREDSSVYLFCNTNKTADIKRSGPQKGYVLPWPTDQPIHRNPYYWLAKLRNWQAKYNPIQRPSSWEELEQARHLSSKSYAQIVQYPPTCFLFRLPEAKLNSEEHLPIPVGVIDTTHYAVLVELERRCEVSGRVSANGMPLKFVSERGESTLYPLHSMRTSLASALVFDGDLQIPELQQVLGHSTRWMTEYYAKQHPTSASKSIAEAMERLESTADSTIESFLRETAFDEIESVVVANDAASLQLGLPRLNVDRNPAGWMHLHHGLCLMGGNAYPIDGIKAVGGCYNGGANIGTVEKPKHGAVEGGQRNCVRCRWFVTSPEYLRALHSHLNVCLFHLHTFQAEWASKERVAEEMRSQRAGLESTGESFRNWKELGQAERVAEASLLKLTECAQTVASTLRLIRRCLAILDEHPESPSAQSFVAVGVGRDLNIAFQNTNSELLHISGVCEAAEIYPELDPGRAVLRQGQLLDTALRREGQLPLFVSLSEPEQLHFGNAILRALGAGLNPKNPQQGRVELIALLEAEERLSDHLGLDMKTVCAKILASRPLSLPSKGKI
ncbi:gamma-mobile-trio integrase GmtZ [Acidovorax delafieldii]|uniref:gamma-mobile-trio integrase GmtZ n=1 Tax=Acidovorax delafieldii TaxID=47920 RepID=UPI003ED09A9E